MPSPADEPRQSAERIRRLTGQAHGPDCAVGDCDPHWDYHGLAWWYPQLVGWVGATTTSGRRGAGGTLAVPVDLTALDFLAGRYWAADEPPRADTVDDPDNYRAGVVVTVLGLEQSARTALGLGRRVRPRAEGYHGLGYDERIPAALGWLDAHADAIADRPQLAEAVAAELLRLIIRARAMMFGSAFEATTNPCRHCEQVDSVVADEDRAVCVNPDCRTPAGLRHCWRLLCPDDWPCGPRRAGACPRVREHGVWAEVEEPDVRGRGRLDDTDLPRWGQHRWENAR